MFHKARVLVLGKDEASLMRVRRARAYPSEWPSFEYSTLGQAPGITHKHLNRLDRLARDKHFSLIDTIVNYSYKTFNNTGS